MGSKYKIGDLVLFKKTLVLVQIIEFDFNDLLYKVDNLKEDCYEYYDELCFIRYTISFKDSKLARLLYGK